MFRVFTAVCVTCCIVFIGGRSFADTTPIGPTDGQVLRVGFNVFPPWRVEEADGTPSGIETEFLRELARRMGVTPHFFSAPFIRNLQNMQSGHVDMMIGVLRRPEREKYMHFIEPPYSTGVRYAFFMRRGMEGALQRYEDLAGLRIGVTNGAAYVDQFDSDQTLIKEPVRSVYQNVEKLLSGRIDVFISEESTARYIIATKGAGHRIAEASYTMGKEQNVYITVSRQSQFAPRRKEIEAHVLQMKHDGVMEKLYQAYFESLLE